MVPKGCRVKGHPQGQNKSRVSKAVPHGVSVTESEHESLRACPPQPREGGCRFPPSPPSGAAPPPGPLCSFPPSPPATPPSPRTSLQLPSQPHSRAALPRDLSAPASCTRAWFCSCYLCLLLTAGPARQPLARRIIQLSH